MIHRASFFMFALLLNSTVLAAHIVTETRNGTTLTQRTDTYANTAGDLRMEDRAYGSSSTMSADAAVGGSAPNVEFHLSENIDDITLFQSNGQAIVMLEGDICRRLTADSEPPPGLGVPGMNLGEANKQMADAMSQAGSAFEEAMKQAKREGMSAEQQRALESFAKPFMEPQDMRPSDTLQLTRLNSRTTVGRYSAEGYSVSDLDGVEKHRVWVVPTSSVAGAKHVRKSMQGMFEMYGQYLDKMGGGALMDTALVTFFNKGELADMYPVRIEDIDAGQVTDVTDVTEAHAGGPDVEYYPDCVEKDMMGF